MQGVFYSVLKFNVISVYFQKSTQETNEKNELFLKLKIFYEKSKFEFRTMKTF